MPPKKRIQKEQILQKAFDLTKEIGYEAITTRMLAEALNCSTQPIYQAYSNMKELKQDLYVKVKNYFSQQMNKNLNSNIPPFLNMGLAYVELAKTEKHLFRFASMSDNYTMTSMQDLVKDINCSDAVTGVSGTEKMSNENMSKLFMMTWIFTHGIASMIATNQVDLSEGEVIKLLTESYEAYAFGKGLNNGK